jgi:ketosteroid isomerase-like protein
MGADKDIELVRAGYAAFSAGDVATLHGLFAEDADRSKGEMRSWPFR